MTGKSWALKFISPCPPKSCISPYMYCYVELQVYTWSTLQNTQCPGEPPSYLNISCPAAWSTHCVRATVAAVTALLRGGEGMEAAGWRGGAVPAPEVTLHPVSLSRSFGAETAGLGIRGADARSACVCASHPDKVSDTSGVF